MTLHDVCVLTGSSLRLAPVVDSSRWVVGIDGFYKRKGKHDMLHGLCGWGETPEECLTELCEEISNSTIETHDGSRKFPLPKVTIS